MKMPAVGIALLSFFFVVGTIVIVGREETQRGFVLAYFLLVLCILGAIYAASARQVHGVSEHALVIIAIIVVSTAFAFSAFNLSNGYSVSVGPTALIEADVQSLQESNRLSLAAQSALMNELVTLQSDNLQLQSNILATHSKILTEKVEKIQQQALEQADALLAQQAQMIREQEAAMQALQEQQAALLAEQQMLPEQAPWQEDDDD